MSLVVFGDLFPKDAGEGLEDHRDVGGLFVAQDGVNAPHAQNFKLVSWAAILKALAKP